MLSEIRADAVQAIFLIVYRCDRGSTKSAEHLLGVCRKRACSVELEADFQKVRDLVVITCIDSHFAELLMLDVSLFVRVTYAQVETMFRRSSGNTDIIVGDECSWKISSCQLVFAFQPLKSNGVSF